MRFVFSIAAVVLLFASCKGEKEGPDRAELEALNRAKRNAAKVTLVKVDNAYQQWRMKTAKRCPSMEQLLEFLDKAPKDPWGSEIVLDCKGDFRAISPGPDKKLGTDDDLSAPEK